MKTHRQSNRRRGFTLIEALAAIAVLVIVIPVLLEGFNLATDVAGFSRQRSEATALAHSILDETIATQAWNTGGLTTSGQEKIGPTSYKWDLQLDNWDEANTQQMTITVRWVHRGKDFDVALTTVIYVPDSTTQTTTSGTTGTIQ